jgi:AraC-like DNA-binding protein
VTGKLTFNTDALPERDRFAAFCEEIIRRYTGLDLTTRDQLSFRSAIELQRAGAVNVGHIFTTPLDSTRTPSLVRDGDDSVLVTLVTSGSGYQMQHDQAQRLAPGDAIISDCGYPGEVNILADSQFWHVRLPRAKIAALAPRSMRFAGARLDKDPVARALLFGYLDAGRQVTLGGSSRVGALYEQHLVDLVALAIGAEADARVLVEQRSMRMVRREAILREIEQHSANPNLSAVVVAIKLGVTPRYVRLVLEETGRSFSEHLLDRRLERAAVLLRDATRANGRIADVAFACGFADLSYFNRVFRRRYGATPSDVREAARQTGKHDDAR